jgi:hypothetical protein
VMADQGFFCAVHKNYEPFSILAANPFAAVSTDASFDL